MEARGHVNTSLALRAGGHTRTVTLASDGADLVATLGDVVCRLTAVNVTTAAQVAGATVETFDLVVDGRPHRATVARTRDRIHVAVDGQAWVFERADDAQHGAGGAAGSGSVVAPMPGKVIAVLVAPGDAVTAGQPLVVVEAMKMETTLVAEIDGTVERVTAQTAGMVDAGAVLVVITPAAV